MSAEAATPQKIVIVDDDADLLHLLAFAFEAESFEIQGIETGKAAMDYLKEEKNAETTSLLVLDRLLPDMDGLEILKHLPPSFKEKVPVLFLSILSAEKDVLSGLKEGAIDYVTKPFSLPIFMEKAMALINRRK